MTKSKQVRLLGDLEDCGFQEAGSKLVGQEHYRHICDCVTSVRMKRDNYVLAAIATINLAVNQPDTVRGNMYSVVSTAPQVLPTTERANYNRVQRLLSRLRDDGVVPYEWIVDNIRQTMKPSSWSGLAEFTETVQEAYRKDFWSSLPDYVCMIVEKDTVAGRIAPVTQEYDVPLHPLRGYSSDTFAWQIGSSWRGIQKPIHVYYIGDHDPRGRDIDRDMREKAWKHSGGCDFEWTRLAVEPHHFDEFNIIPLEPKKKDTCSANFRAKYGSGAAEVEAIPAAALRDIVRAAIESHIPQDQWQQLRRIEEQERETWVEMLKKVQGECA